MRGALAVRKRALTSLRVLVTTQAASHTARRDFAAASLAPATDGTSRFCDCRLRTDSLLVKLTAA